MPNVFKMAEKYTDSPGARYKSQGEHSGEEFRETVLLPLFNEYYGKSKIIIDIDGLNGYPSSFFEESFGGLARTEGITPKMVLDTFEIICNDDPVFKDDVISYIKQEFAPK